MASVKVAVRVRPFNQREIDMEAQLIIQMQGKTTGILNSKANTRDESIRYKEFTFDYSYWSHDEQSPNYASQETVYHNLGTEVIDCAFGGYNACVFAYGQTGSGKTFTMMGCPEKQGLIPRICKALFERMAENSKRGTTHRVQVSYLEIYQERVADLLRGREGGSLKVREHPKRGPYVEGLTTCLVTNYGHIQECMERGNAHRTTAATNMNDVSSRSHAIFTVTFVQAGYRDGVPSETVSKIHLVDLAGSERADATGATGQRLKEGAHINKSLVTLGSVISALAELSSEQKNGQRRSIFIPYRDSVLTWLLKDSLGGNSKTIMIAAISPADCNYGETLSTLRYANRAKNIINKPTVNEDANVKLIRELRDEISKLRALMFCEQRSDMLAQLHEKEAREKELTEEWTGKWREAQAILREQRALGLRKAGPGVVLDSDRPHLVAIDDDPLTTGVTLYHLKEGKTTIGTEEADVKQDIELRGSGMEAQHCAITFENGVATLIPQPGASVMLNSCLLESPAKLSQGCIIFLGKAHVFRFNDPAEAAELRKGERRHNLSRLSLLSWSTPDLAVSMENLQISADEEKVDMELQRSNLEKERERLEIEQKAFEEKRTDLELAQARLEAERVSVREKHDEQTRQLHEDWRIMTAQQREKELQLQKAEKELILKREDLERERQKLLGNINQECELMQEVKADILIKFHDACLLVASNMSEISFCDPNEKLLFQELVSKSDLTPLSDDETDSLMDILNNVTGSSLIQDLVVRHRKELAELQAELNRRVRSLCERQKSVELLDRKIVDLVDEQKSLNTEDDEQEERLDGLKEMLSKRTEEELMRIEQKKQSLTLNLSPTRCSGASQPPVDRWSCCGRCAPNTLSSGTYHTAAGSCCSPAPSAGFGEPRDGLMSDSGVEIRPRQPKEALEGEDDASSCEEGSASARSDSRSSSSVENKSPIGRLRRARRRERDVLVRRLAQRMAHQKQLIVGNLDGRCDKGVIDDQIAVLQELQRQYMVLKYGRSSGLSPAFEHPLQNVDSPGPMGPLHTGSVSNLYSISPLQLQNHLSFPYNGNLYRSMPSIPTDSDNESIVSILSYRLKGTGKRVHHEYEVQISTMDERYTIFRRYRRFRDLHLAMKARYRDTVSRIAFPSRILFPNKDSVAQARRKQLEQYLRRLIEACRDRQGSPLCKDGPVRAEDLVSFSQFFKKGVLECDRCELS